MVGGERFAVALPTSHCPSACTQMHWQPCSEWPRSAGRDAWPGCTTTQCCPCVYRGGGASPWWWCWGVGGGRVGRDDVHQRQGKPREPQATHPLNLAPAPAPRPRARPQPPPSRHAHTHAHRYHGPLAAQEGYGSQSPGPGCYNVAGTTNRGGTAPGGSFSSRDSPHNTRCFGLSSRDSASKLFISQ